MYKTDKDGQIVDIDTFSAKWIRTMPDGGVLGMMFDELEDADVAYNSELDTLKHIKRVGDLLTDAVKILLDRARVHDASKLEFNEKYYFDRAVKKLKNLDYGSPKYKEALKELGPGLKSHYRNNSHHPEHYEDGVNGMDLFDIIEMFFDWKAASERHDTGNIYNSIEHNKGRFFMSEQLAQIFINTAKNMGYKK